MKHEIENYFQKLEIEMQNLYPFQIYVFSSEYETDFDLDEAQNNSSIQVQYFKPIFLAEYLEIFQKETNSWLKKLQYVDIELIYLDFSKSLIKLSSEEFFTEINGRECSFLFDKPFYYDGFNLKGTLQYKKLDFYSEYEKLSISIQRSTNWQSFGEKFNFKWFKLFESLFDKKISTTVFIFDDSNMFVLIDFIEKDIEFAGDTLQIHSILCNLILIKINGIYQGKDWEIELKKNDGDIIILTNDDYQNNNFDVCYKGPMTLIHNFYKEKVIVHFNNTLTIFNTLINITNFQKLVEYHYTQFFRKERIHYVCKSLSNDKIFSLIYFPSLKETVPIKDFPTCIKCKNLFKLMSQTFDIQNDEFQNKSLTSCNMLLDRYDNLIIEGKGKYIKREYSYKVIYSISIDYLEYYEDNILIFHEKSLGCEMKRMKEDIYFRFQ